MTTDAQIRVETPLTAPDVFERVCQLYISVFSEPQFDRSADKLAAQRDSLTSLMADPTFGMVTAWDGPALVGFGYGHALGKDTRWWEGFLAPVPTEIAGEWDGRTFAVIDMAVAAAHRGRGIGKLVLGSLVANRPEERASLAVVPENEAAQGFYRHLGWQHIGRIKGAPHHVAPFFDIYLLNLR